MVSGIKYTHSHTQTEGTNVSHILTNSDNREHGSCIYNDGAQQLFIEAAFVTRVISIFGWQEVLGAVNDLWCPMKYFYQTCLWRKKKNQLFTILTSAIISVCPNTASLRSHSYHLILFRELLKTWKHTGDGDETLRLKVCPLTLPGCIYLSHMLLAKQNTLVLDKKLKSPYSFVSLQQQAF